MGNINKRLEKIEKLTHHDRGDLRQFLEDWSNNYQKAYGGEKDPDLLSIKTWDEWDRYVKDILDAVYGPEEGKK
jgi:hypothetical protein